MGRTTNIKETNMSENVQKEAKKEIVSKQKLLEAGTYFGHRTAQWNPKMKPYIHMAKKGTHIIDIQQTQRTLEFAYQIISKFASRDASFIFVGTRKQSKKAVKENALRVRQSYVSERWLGGILTNNRTIFQRVRRMQELERLQEAGYVGYTKKEGVLFTKELEKLQRNLNGIRNMKGRPHVMIVVDPQHDLNAVKEARRLGMKIVGITDTNCDPSLVDIAIPANDDSAKSITLILTILADAIASAKGGTELFAFKSDEEIVLPEEPRKERTFNRGPRRFNDNRRPFNRNERTNTRREEPKKEEVKKEVKEESKDLSSHTVAELREMAKAKKLKGYSTLKKAELIEALKA
ncbi:30S ribosomal protein S2 [Mycoplasma marinum]|uniref:Small ribosomal subunit protein uS2 n=2 Tax=Mycoplasma marinum TaxID=1937190 RepID=A0A4R0XMW9_9MOLU|nr:30S ribosomal protein S2 [Mycoplasma marinum]